MLSPFDDEVFREVPDAWNRADRFLDDDTSEETDDDVLKSSFPDLDEILPDLAADVLRHWR